MFPHAQLSAAALHVRRGGRAVITELNIALTPGSRVGVVGENGSGKTTLLDVLAGRLEPDSGSVTRIGTIGVVSQELAGETVGDLINAATAPARAALSTLDSALAGLAAGGTEAQRAYEKALAVAQSLDAWDVDRRIDVALAGLAACPDRDRQLSTLSVGQQYRVWLAGILGVHHDFLLLDEPTNHLDDSGLVYLSTQLRASAAGIVLVSHDRALLSDVATSILDLDPSPDGRPVLYGNGFSGYRNGRRGAWQRWREQYDRQVARHEELSQALVTAQDRLVTGWKPPKGTPAHLRATRAPSIVRSVRRREADLIRNAVTLPPPPLELAFPDLPAGSVEPLLSVEGAAVAGRLAAVDLSLHAGVRLLVTGGNGAGKSTLLGLLAGDLTATSGAVRRSPEVRIALVSQQSWGYGQKRVRDLIVEDFGLFRPADYEKRANELSTGQRRRLDLAIALASRPHVLLLDEPSNHLSMALVEELTEALQLTPAAVVVASHDRQLRRDLSSWPELPITGATADSPSWPLSDTRARP